MAPHRVMTKRVSISETTSDNRQSSLQRDGRGRFLTPSPDEPPPQPTPSFTARSSSRHVLKPLSARETPPLATGRHLLAGQGSIGLPVKRKRGRPRKVDIPIVKKLPQGRPRHGQRDRDVSMVTRLRPKMKAATVETESGDAAPSATSPDTIIQHELLNDTDTDGTLHIPVLTTGRCASVTNEFLDELRVPVQDTHALPAASPPPSPSPSYPHQKQLAPSGDASSTSIHSQASSTYRNTNSFIKDRKRRREQTSKSKKAQKANPSLALAYLTRFRIHALEPASESSDEPDVHPATKDAGTADDVLGVGAVNITQTGCPNEPKNESPDKISAKELDFDYTPIVNDLPATISSKVPSQVPPQVPSQIPPQIPAQTHSLTVNHTPKKRGRPPNKKVPPLKKRGRPPKDRSSEASLMNFMSSKWTRFKTRAVEDFSEQITPTTKPVSTESSPEKNKLSVTENVGIPDKAYQEDQIKTSITKSHKSQKQSHKKQHSNAHLSNHSSNGHHSNKHQSSAVPHSTKSSSDSVSNNDSGIGLNYFTRTSLKSVEQMFKKMDPNSAQSDNSEDQQNGSDSPKNQSLSSSDENVNSNSRIIPLTSSHKIGRPPKKQYHKHIQLLKRSHASDNDFENRFLLKKKKISHKKMKDVRSDDTDNNVPSKISHKKKTRVHSDNFSDLDYTIPEKKSYKKKAIKTKPLESQDLPQRKKRKYTKKNQNKPLANDSRLNLKSVVVCEKYNPSKPSVKAATIQSRPPQKSVDSQHCQTNFLQMLVDAAVARVEAKMSGKKSGIKDTPRDLVINSAVAASTTYQTTGDFFPHVSNDYRGIYHGAGNDCEIERIPCNSHRKMSETKSEPRGHQTPKKQRHPSRVDGWVSTLSLQKPHQETSSKYEADFVFSPADERLFLSSGGREMCVACKAWRRRLAPFCLAHDRTLHLAMRKRLSLECKHHCLSNTEYLEKYKCRNGGVSLFLQALTENSLRSLIVVSRRSNKRDRRLRPKIKVYDLDEVPVEGLPELISFSTSQQNKGSGGPVEPDNMPSLEKFGENSKYNGRIFPFKEFLNTFSKDDNSLFPWHQTPPSPPPSRPVSPEDALQAARKSKSATSQDPAPSSSLSRVKAQSSATSSPSRHKPRDNIFELVFGDENLGNALVEELEYKVGVAMDVEDVVVEKVEVMARDPETSHVISHVTSRVSSHVVSPVTSTLMGAGLSCTLDVPEVAICEATIVESPMAASKLEFDDGIAQEEDNSNVRSFTVKSLEELCQTAVENYCNSQSKHEIPKVFLEDENNDPAQPSDQNETQIGTNEPNVYSVVATATKPYIKAEVVEQASETSIKEEEYGHAVNPLNESMIATSNVLDSSSSWIERLVHKPSRTERLNLVDTLDQVFSIKVSEENKKLLEHFEISVESSSVAANEQSSLSFPHDASVKYEISDDRSDTMSIPSTASVNSSDVTAEHRVYSDTQSVHDAPTEHSLFSSTVKVEVASMDETDFSAETNSHASSNSGAEHEEASSLFVQGTERNPLEKPVEITNPPVVVNSLSCVDSAVAAKAKTETDPETENENLTEVVTRLASHNQSPQDYSLQEKNPPNSEPISMNISDKLTHVEDVNSESQPVHSQSNKGSLNEEKTLNGPSYVLKTGQLQDKNNVVSETSDDGQFKIYRPTYHTTGSADTSPKKKLRRANTSNETNNKLVTNKSHVPGFITLRFPPPLIHSHLLNEPFPNALSHNIVPPAGHFKQNNTTLPSRPLNNNGYVVDGAIPNANVPTPSCDSIFHSSKTLYSESPIFQQASSSHNVLFPGPVKLNPSPLQSSKILGIEQMKWHHLVESHTKIPPFSNITVTTSNTVAQTMSTTTTSSPNRQHASLQIIPNKKLTNILSSKLLTGNYTSSDVTQSTRITPSTSHKDPPNSQSNISSNGPLDLSTPHKELQAPCAAQKPKMFLNPTSTQALEPLTRPRPAPCSCSLPSCTARKAQSITSSPFENNPHHLIESHTSRDYTHQPPVSQESCIAHKHQTHQSLSQQGFILARKAKVQQRNSSPTAWEAQIATAQRTVPSNPDRLFSESRASGIHQGHHPARQPHVTNVKSNCPVVRNPRLAHKQITTKPIVQVNDTAAPTSSPQQYQHHHTGQNLNLHPSLRHHKGPILKNIQKLPGASFVQQNQSQHLASKLSLASQTHSDIYNYGDLVKSAISAPKHLERPTHSPSQSKSPNPTVKPSEQQASSALSSANKSYSQTETLSTNRASPSLPPKKRETQLLAASQARSSPNDTSTRPSSPSTDSNKLGLPVQDFFKQTQTQNSYSSLLMAKIASRNKAAKAASFPANGHNEVQSSSSSSNFDTSFDRKARNKQTKDEHRAMTGLNYPQPETHAPLSHTHFPNVTVSVGHNVNMDIKRSASDTQQGPFSVFAKASSATNLTTPEVVVKQEIEDIPLSNGHHEAITNTDSSETISYPVQNNDSNEQSDISPININVSQSFNNTIVANVLVKQEIPDTISSYDSSETIRTSSSQPTPETRVANPTETEPITVLKLSAILLQSHNDETLSRSVLRQSTSPRVGNAKGNVIDELNTVIDRCMVKDWLDSNNAAIGALKDSTGMCTLGSVETKYKVVNLASNGSRSHTKTILQDDEGDKVNDNISDTFNDEVSGKPLDALVANTNIVSPGAQASATEADIIDNEIDIYEGSKCKDKTEEAINPDVLSNSNTFNIAEKCVEKSIEKCSEKSDNKCSVESVEDSDKKTPINNFADKSTEKSAEKYINSNQCTIPNNLSVHPDNPVRPRSEPYVFPSANNSDDYERLKCTSQPPFGTFGPEHQIGTSPVDPLNLSPPQDVPALHRHQHAQHGHLTGAPSAYFHHHRFNSQIRPPTPASMQGPAAAAAVNSNVLRLLQFRAPTPKKS